MWNVVSKNIPEKILRKYGGLFTFGCFEATCKMDFFKTVFSTGSHKQIDAKLIYGWYFIYIYMYKPLLIIIYNIVILFLSFFEIWKDDEMWTELDFSTDERYDLFQENHISGIIKVARANKTCAAVRVCTLYFWKALGSFSHPNTLFVFKQKINLRNCFGINDAAIQSISQNFVNLRVFKLDGSIAFSCLLITDAGIASLCENCPLLEQVELRRCTEITYESCNVSFG